MIAFILSPLNQNFAFWPSFFCCLSEAMKFICRLYVLSKVVECRWNKWDKRLHLVYDAVSLTILDYIGNIGKFWWAVFITVSHSYDIDIWYLFIQVAIISQRGQWALPSHRDSVSVTGDGDDDFALYASDILDDVCGSDGDPIPSSALADDPASPLLSDDEASPREPLSIQHSSIYMPQEDLTIPLDFELRESAVPGGGLGIWSRRKVNVGERFGPYMGEHRPCLRDPNQGWEVGT